MRNNYVVPREIFASIFRVFRGLRSCLWLLLEPSVFEARRVAEYSAVIRRIRVSFLST